MRDLLLDHRRWRRRLGLKVRSRFDGTAAAEFEVLDVGVRLQVFGEPFAPAKLFAAIVAVVRILARVNANVTGQVLFAGK